jgi:hypothetical protein
MTLSARASYLVADGAAFGFAQEKGPRSMRPRSFNGGTGDGSGTHEWIIMRDSKNQPAAVVRRLRFVGEVFFRVVTWAPTSEGRELVGYFPSLELADRSVKFRPPILIAQSGPPNGRGASPSHSRTL